MDNLSPHTPKKSTVMISLAIVLIGLLGATFSPFIADNGDWFLLVGYLLLLLGVYIKGL